MNVKANAKTACFSRPDLVTAAYYNAAYIKANTQVLQFYSLHPGCVQDSFFFAYDSRPELYTSKLAITISIFIIIMAIVKVVLKIIRKEIKRVGREFYENN